MNKQDEDAIRWSELERCLAWIDTARRWNAQGGQLEIVENALWYVRERMESGAWPSKEE